MTDQPDDLEIALQGFLKQWPDDAFKDDPDRKTYLVGNLRGFTDYLRIMGMGVLLEKLDYDQGAIHLPTRTLTAFEKFRENVQRVRAKYGI